MLLWDTLGYFDYLLIFAKLIRIHGTNTDVLNKKSDIYSPTPYVSSAYRFIGPGVCLIVILRSIFLSKHFFFILKLTISIKTALYIFFMLSMPITTK